MFTICLYSVVPCLLSTASSVAFATIESSLFPAKICSQLSVACLQFHRLGVSDEQLALVQAALDDAIVSIQFSSASNSNSNGSEDGRLQLALSVGSQTVQRSRSNSNSTSAGDGDVEMTDSKASSFSQAQSPSQPKQQQVQQTANPLPSAFKTGEFVSHFPSLSELRSRLPAWLPLGFGQLRFALAHLHRLRLLLARQYSASGAAAKPATLSVSSAPAAAAPASVCASVAPSRQLLHQQPAGNFSSQQQQQRPSATAPSAAAGDFKASAAPGFVRASALMEIDSDAPSAASLLSQSNSATASSSFSAPPSSQQQRTALAPLAVQQSAPGSLQSAAAASSAPKPVSASAPAVGSKFTTGTQKTKTGKARGFV